MRNRFHFVLQCCLTYFSVFSVSLFQNCHSNQNRHSILSHQNRSFKIATASTTVTASAPQISKSSRLPLPKDRFLVEANHNTIKLRLKKMLCYLKVVIIKPCLYHCIRAGGYSACWQCDFAKGPP